MCAIDRTAGPWHPGAGAQHHLPPEGSPPLQKPNVGLWRSGSAPDLQKPFYSLPNKRSLAKAFTEKRHVGFSKNQEAGGSKDPFSRSRRARSKHPFCFGKTVRLFAKAQKVRSVRGKSGKMVRNSPRVHSYFSFSGCIVNPMPRHVICNVHFVKAKCISHRASLDADS